MAKSESEFREITKKLEFPILGNYQIYIIISNDMFTARKKRDKWLGEFDGSNEEYTAAFHSHPHGSGQSYIFLPERAAARFISHECFHAICAMFDFIDAHPDEETIAHVLGHVVEQVVQLEGRRKSKETSDRRRKRKSTTGRRNRSRRNNSARRKIHTVTKVRDRQTRYRQTDV